LKLERLHNVNNHIRAPLGSGFFDFLRCGHDSFLSDHFLIMGTNRPKKEHIASFRAVSRIVDEVRELPSALQSTGNAC
ncbi:MAG: hypothetical protein ACREQV_17855, partial [Candidatus Binatia bacterium]